jgi:hypothetical protein
VTYLKAVPQAPDAARFRPGAFSHPGIVSAGERSCRGERARKKPEKVLDSVPIVFKAGRQLPKDRTELVTEAQNPRGEEVGQRRFDILQAFDVGDKSTALYRKKKPVGRSPMPRFVAFGL